jgi:hypothetical protein
MTAHHQHRFDRLRVDPPPEAPDYSGADLQIDAADMLDGLEVVGCYSGDGELYGLRIGALTLTEAQVRLMLGPQHFAAVQWLTTDELRRALDDWTAARLEEVRADD